LKNFLIIYSLLAFTSCTHLFFQPDHYLYAPPEKLNLKYKNIVFDSADKTRLHSWFFEADVNKGEESKGLIVLFHGNAQNLSSHYLSVSWLVRYQYDVWVWDYRGYGLSQGIAESKGVYEDSLAALSFAESLYSKKDSYKKLILIGQSLGGNILMRAVSEHQIAKKADLLVVDSTFLSYQKMASDRLQSVWFLYPFSILTGLLVSDEYSAYEHAKKIQMPTLVMHGKKDAVVPFKFGEEVYKTLQTPVKEFWPIEEGRHIGTLGNGKKETEKKFLEFISRLSGNSSS
jgi:hypothetical protein